MKKAFIFAAILLAVATTITIVSCKKDKQEEKVTKNVNLTENEQEENMDEYLLSLKQKMLSAQKGDETISLEQARHDLCDLLNFDFGDANYASDVFQHDTIYVKLALTNGMVDLSQLAVTYNNALEQIMTSYRTFDLPEKSVYAIFCEYNDISSKEDDTEEMRIIVNYRGFRGSPSIYDTLEWHPRDIDKCCNDPSIQYGGPNEMQRWLRNSQSPIGCPNGGRVYFTNEHDWFKHGDLTYDPIENRYKIFTLYTTQIDTVCLSHDDMVYYYNNILDYYYQEAPGFQTIEDVEVHCFKTDILQPNGTHEVHYYWRIFIRHGKANCTQTDPIV